MSHQLLTIELDMSLKQTVVLLFCFCNVWKPIAVYFMLPLKGQLNEHQQMEKHCKNTKQKCVWGDVNVTEPKREALH